MVTVSGYRIRLARGSVPEVLKASLSYVFSPEQFELLDLDEEAFGYDLGLIVTSGWAKEAQIIQINKALKNCSAMAGFVEDYTEAVAPSDVGTAVDFVRAQLRVNCGPPNTTKTQDGVTDED